MKRKKILVVKSVNDELFRRLYPRVREIYADHDLLVLCREEEVGKLRDIYRGVSFIPYRGDRFSAIRVLGQVRVKIEEEGVERAIILFRDKYGARYFHYRIFPLIAGHTRFTSINALGEVTESGIWGWLQKLLLCETRIRVNSLLDLLDVTRFFLVGIYYLLLQKAGLIKREDSPGTHGSILFFISSLGMGGAQRQLYFLTKELTQKGFDVDIACIWRDDAFFEEEFAKLGVPVIYLVDEYDYWFTSTLISRLTTRLGEKKYRVIHNWMVLSNIIGTMSGMKARIPGIVNSVRTIELKSYPWYRSWYKYADTLAFRLADSTIVNSEAVCEDYSRWVNAGGRDDKIRLVYNGFDISMFNGIDESLPPQFKATEDDRIVGFFGRLSEEKDVFTFLKALSILIESNKRLRAMICGDGYQLDEVRSFLAGRNLEERVLVPGHVEEVYRFMKACDVIVSTSQVEGLPNVLIEAQLLGVPVVATDAGGTRETFEDGKTGYLVGKGDVDGIVGRVSEFLDSCELRRSFGHAGTVRARRLFSVDRMVESTLSVYGA